MTDMHDEEMESEEVTWDEMLDMIGEYAVESNEDEQHEIGSALMGAGMGLLVRVQFPDPPDDVVTLIQDKLENMANTMLADVRKLYIQHTERN